MKPHSHRYGYWWQVGLGVAIALLVSGLPLRMQAQLPVPLTTPTPQPAPSLTKPTPGLEINLPPLGWRSVGNEANLDKAHIWLDGRRLFAIAALSDSSGQNEALQLRASTIEARLRRIVSRNFDPTTLNVVVDRSSQNRLPILNVVYGTGADQQRVELMTVTTLDAQVNGSEPTLWAEELAPIIEAALVQAKQERQPGFVQGQTLWAIAILGMVMLGSVLLAHFQRNLQRQRHLWHEERFQVERSAHTPPASNIPPAPNGGLPPLPPSVLQERVSRRQQRSVNEILRRLLQLAQVGLWVSGVYLLLGLIPQSRGLQPVMLYWLQIPLKLFLVIFVTYLLIRLSDLLIDRLFLFLQDGPAFAPERSQRIALRFSTFARATKGVLAFLLVLIGGTVLLSIIGVRVGPLLAGAGIIGIAISLASQNLIKDFINGLLILLEDQYGVGDIIVIDKVSGLVENMNLRITQLRNEEGRLITIPNGAISIVQNLSKEWSRVDLQVSVAYDADLEKALEVINQVAQEMTVDPYWGEFILEQPQLLGVDKLDYTGATIRLWIKTKPLKQWEVAREYRRRLKAAFDREDVPIGIPQQSLWIGNSQELDEVLEPKVSDRPSEPGES